MAIFEVVGRSGFLFSGLRQCHRFLALSDGPSIVPVLGSCGKANQTFLRGSTSLTRAVYRVVCFSLFTFLNHKRIATGFLVAPPPKKKCFLWISLQNTQPQNHGTLQNNHGFPICRCAFCSHRLRHVLFASDASTTRLGALAGVPGAAHGGRKCHEDL